MKKKRVKINLLSNDDYCTTTIISIINKLMRAGNVFFFAEDGIVELKQIINEAQWKCYKLFENDSGKMFIVDSAILLIENIREIDLKMIFENWTYWNGSERWLFVFDDKMADYVREIVNNSARLKKRKIREIEKKALLYIGVNELGAEMEQYNSYVMEIEYEETRNIVNELTDLVAGSCEIHIDIG